MSASNIPSATNRLSPPRSPTYAEALRAPKPAPINTDVNNGGFNSNVTTANTFSTANASSGWGSLRSSRTPATSLYPSSIWSPIPESTQSATIPKKLSWETKVVPVVPASPYASVQPVGMGLGVNFDAQYKSPSANTAPQSPTRYQYQQGKLTEAKISPFHFEAKNPDTGTFPIMQRPFGSTREAADQHRITSNPSPSPTATHPSNVPIGSEMKAAAGKGLGPSNLSGATDANKDHGTLNVPRRPDSVSDKHRDSSGPSAPSELTAFTGSSTGKRSNMELIEQESHSKGFAGNLRAGHKPDDIVEAFQGGYNALKGLNGQFIALPPNARVICIKTEFVTNIHWSIKNRTWAAMTKVGTRIMRVWEGSKADPGSKVYLLFSINGQKSYCGLAEMTGDFEEGEPVSGWCKNNSMQEMGTFPVTWLSLKNVSYSWFSDIHHSHNDGPITNMWNGMHFPHVAGLEVIRRYYRRPHFTNVLCWDKNGTYFPLKGNTQPEQIDPGLAYLRAAKHAQRWVTGHPPKLLLENKPIEGHRDRATDPLAATGSNTVLVDPTARANGQEHRTAVPSDADRQEQKNSPSTLDGRRGQSLVVDATTPPQLDGTNSSTHRAGQIVTCIIDANGNYVPVSPGGNQSSHMKTPGRDTPTEAHTYVHTPARPQQYTPQGTPTPIRGPGDYAGRNGDGSIYSPAQSTLIGSGGGSMRSNGKFPYQGGPVVNENLRGPDDFATPNTLRPAKKYGNVAPPTPTHAPGNRIVTAFQHYGNFAPHQGLPRQVSDSNMTVVPAGSPWSRATAKAVSPPHVAPQQVQHPSIAQHNTESYLSKLQRGPPPVERSTRGSTGNPVPSFVSFAGIDRFDDATLRALAKDSAKVLIATKRALAINHEISRRQYFRDSRRSFYPDSPPSKYDGSEPGGLGCVVSGSSVEKERMSPVPTLGGSVRDAEKEKVLIEREQACLEREKACYEREKMERELAEWETRLHEDVERLLLSPQPSVVNPCDVDGGASEGGVLLDY